MREVGKSLDIDLFVFGPETHMTAIVAMSLGELDTYACVWCWSGYLRDPGLDILSRYAFGSRYMFTKYYIHWFNRNEKMY